MEQTLPHYSSKRKAAVVKKLLPPENQAVSVVSEEEGICSATLYNWLKQARKEGVPVPGSQRKHSEEWDGASKFAVVLETSGMNASELGEYCRQKGLYPEQITRWKQACIAGASDDAIPSQTSRQELKQARAQIKRLEKDLNRKEKALAESAALLVLQKKYQALWEDEVS